MIDGFSCRVSREQNQKKDPTDLMMNQCLNDIPMMAGIRELLNQLMNRTDREAPSSSVPYDDCDDCVDFDTDCRIMNWMQVIPFPSQFGDRMPAFPGDCDCYAAVHQWRWSVWLLLHREKNFCAPVYVMTGYPVVLPNPADQIQWWYGYKQWILVYCSTDDTWCMTSFSTISTVVLWSGIDTVDSFLHPFASTAHDLRQQLPDHPSGSNRSHLFPGLRMACNQWERLPCGPGTGISIPVSVWMRIPCWNNECPALEWFAIPSGSLVSEAVLSIQVPVHLKMTRFDCCFRCCYSSAAGKHTQSSGSTQTSLVWIESSSCEDRLKQMIRQHHYRHLEPTFVVVVAVTDSSKSMI